MCEQVGDQRLYVLYLCRAHIVDLLSSSFNLLVRNAVIAKPSSMLNYISLNPHISPNSPRQAAASSSGAAPGACTPATSSGRRSISAQSPGNIGDLPLDIAS